MPTEKPLSQTWKSLIISCAACLNLRVPLIARTCSNLAVVRSYLKLQAEASSKTARKCYLVEWLCSRIPWDYKLARMTHSVKPLALRLDSARQEGTSPSHLKWTVWSLKSRGNSNFLSRIVHSLKLIDSLPPKISSRHWKVFAQASKYLNQLLLRIWRLSQIAQNSINCWKTLYNKFHHQDGPTRNSKQSQAVK